MTTEQQNILELFNNDNAELAEMLSESTGNKLWFEEYINSQIKILRNCYTKHFKTDLPNEEYRNAVYSKTINSPYNFKTMARRLGFSNRIINATISNSNFIIELTQNVTTKRYTLIYN